MSRAWAWLAALVAALALVVVTLRRLPHPATAPVRPAPSVELGTLTLVVRDGSVSPADTAFALGSRLALTRVNAGGAPARVALAGYERTLPERTLAPGASCRDTIQLDLPGGDFAWRVDGAPAGRFAVSGPHLVEGHR